MAYPLVFKRLVLGGTLFTEEWNTGLSIVADGNGAVTDAELASMATVVSTWWSSTGAAAPFFMGCAKLTYIKLNRIDTSGHYMDPESKTHVYTTPIAGTSAGDTAPQLTPVVTLQTAFERGLANRGRMYLPPAQGFQIPGADGRATAANALRLANAVAALINSINTTMSTQSGSPRVAVLSNVGSGAWHSVTKTKTGRVFDTMRSRRSSLDEDYQQNTTAITP